MAIAEDGSAPASVHTASGSGVTFITTASFTPVAGSLLVAVAESGSNTGGLVTCPVTDSLGSTWTLLKRANAPAGNGGSAEVWAMDAGASPAARTVTATGTGGTFATGVSLTVKVLTGALPAASCLGASATALGTTAYSIAITPLTLGSLLAGGLVDVVTATGALTANGVTTVWQSFLDAGSTEKYAEFRAASLTAVTGSPVTIGFSTTAGDSQNLVAVEILPAAVAAGGAAPGIQYAPAYWPGRLPGLPGGTPFVPWPLPGPAAAGGVPQDLLTAAATITATITASLSTAPSPYLLPPRYPPAWFPAAPGAPGAEPFTAWPLGQTGVNSAVLTAAATVTSAGAAALTEAKPVNAAATVTAARAAAFTGAKPLNAAGTVTASRAAAETTAKPVSAAQTVTAALSAALDVVKAGVTPVPAYPPAWFPAAPGVPGGEPFAPWPVWSGFAGTTTPQDLLTAATTVTASRAAALTETKPVTAATTVTASRAAAETTAKPLNAAATVTGSRAAAETTAKPVNAATTVTAALSASLTTVPAAPAAFAPAPLYVPAWFPGAPAVPAAEAFAPWPVWTGALPAPTVVFTIGSLTAGDKPGSTLTGGTASSALAGSTAPSGALAATDQRTGGPS